MRYLSLFHGIGAVDLAWAPLGWTCAAYAEIEPFPIAVTTHRHPGVPNLGDVTKITDEQIEALGPLDLVVGGSPCQDLSVAGKRAGLAGERSGLFHEQMRIFHAARSLCGARFLLWENVPGAFSSHGGRDFGVVVGAMAGAELAVPSGGWGTCGAAIGENGLVEWRVLDAQYVRVESHPRAVPQRRRRVFALLDTGDWRDRPPVLLEPEGLCGHPAPRRETGERTAASAGCGASVGRTIRAFDGGIDREDGHTLVAAVSSGRGWLDESDVGATIRAQDSITKADTLVAHSLDKSSAGSCTEDGTGRGVPLVPVCMSSGQANAEISEGHAPTLNCLHEAPIVGFAQNQRDEVREVEVAGALSAEPGMKQQTYLAMAVRTANTSANGHGVSEGVEHTLDQAQGQAIAFRANASFAEEGFDLCGTLNAENQHAIVFSIMPQNSGKDFKARPVDVAQPLMAGGPVAGNQGGDYILEMAAPIAMLNMQGSKGNSVAEENAETSFTLNAMHGHDVHAITFSCKDRGADAGDIAPTLRSMEFDGSHANGGGQVAVAFESRFARNGRGAPSDVVPPLKAQSGETGKGDGAPLVAIAFKASHFTRGKDGAPDEVTPPLSADADKGDQDTLLAAPSLTVGFDEVADPVAANQARTYTREGSNNFRVSNVAIAAMQVRRLTPRECERLQGFPDDYTAVPIRGKPAADGPRYRALGNSMAVNVMRHIADRIEAVA